MCYNDYSHKMNVVSTWSSATCLTSNILGFEEAFVEEAQRRGRSGEFNKTSVAPELRITLVALMQVPMRQTMIQRWHTSLNNFMPFTLTGSSYERHVQRQQISVQRLWRYSDVRTPLEEQSKLEDLGPIAATKRTDAPSRTLHHGVVTIWLHDASVNVLTQAYWRLLSISANKNQTFSTFEIAAAKYFRRLTSRLTSLFRVRLTNSNRKWEKPVCAPLAHSPSVDLGTLPNAPQHRQHCPLSWNLMPKETGSHLRLPLPLQSNRNGVATQS